MSFHEVSIAVRAENRASTTFRAVALDVANLGAAFGFLSNEQVKAVSVIFTVIRVAQSMKAIVESATIAQKIHTAATWLATTAQTALNISYGTFLALTGVGIAVIVAAAAAMAYFASQMNSATSSVQSFNVAAAEMPTRTRGIQRAGESAVVPRSSSGQRSSGSDGAVLLRRGIE